MPDSLRDHPSVRTFVGAASRYCRLVESTPPDPDAWMQELLHAISILYAAAPIVRELDINTAGQSIPADLRLSNDQWQVIYSHLMDTLPITPIYSAHFNPVDAAPNDEAGTGDLADDLADIYRDLRPGLAAWELSGDAYTDDILYQWVHFGHLHHWGRHAVNAMRALHWAVYK
jgi:hypothetical protein